MFGGGAVEAGEEVARFVSGGDEGDDEVLGDREEVADPPDGGGGQVRVASENSGHHGKDGAGTIEVSAADFFDPRDAVTPEFLKEALPDGEVHGAGMENRKEGLIRHELDHPDDEEKTEENTDPALRTFEVERHPAEEEVFHIGGCNEEDEGCAEPLFEVIFQFLLHLADAHALADDEPEYWDRNEAHQDSGEGFEKGAEDCPAKKISEHVSRVLSEDESKEKPLSVAVHD